MYIIMRKGKDAIVEEHHLCSICCKMFCCNQTSYVCLRQNVFKPEETDQYAHKQCVEAIPEIGALK